MIGLIIVKQDQYIGFCFFVNAFLYEKAKLTVCSLLGMLELPHGPYRLFM
ncbi:MAG: hypothetical protein IJ852_01990 [Alphaproteobacteria bacterium]|nr:hypothetical protein [Alphaproteobacteria bacterium]